MDKQQSNSSRAVSIYRRAWRVQGWIWRCWRGSGTEAWTWRYAAERELQTARDDTDLGLLDGAHMRLVRAIRFLRASGVPRHRG